MFITRIRWIRVLPFLLIISFIQGCKSEINSDLYVQDIFSEENLILPMQLSFEVPSCNSESRVEHEA